MMTPEQERWTRALEIERRHGDRARAFVAERIGALVLADDPAGVERWRTIAYCLDMLRTDHLPQ